MDDTSFRNEEFLQKIGDQVLERIAAKAGLRGFSTNLRGNVIEIPMNGVMGCHYEIGLHGDCHEIALHFQAKEQTNVSRLNGFYPYSIILRTKLGYKIILGPHEKSTGRKRLWIKLPLHPLRQDLLEKYSELMSNLIVETFPILRSILEQERKLDN